MGFPRQEYCSELPLLSPGDWTWVSCIAGRFFTIWATRKPIYMYVCIYIHTQCIFKFYNHRNNVFFCHRSVKQENLFWRWLQIVTGGVWMQWNGDEERYLYCTKLSLHKLLITYKGTYYNYIMGNLAIKVIKDNINSVGSNQHYRPPEQNTLRQEKQDFDILQKLHTLNQIIRNHHKK